MNADQAQKIAKKYLDAQPSPDPDYCWALSKGRQVNDVWYFSYAFEHVRGVPESEWDHFAGAPGFVVPADGSPPRDISWHEYRDLLD